MKSSYDLGRLRFPLGLCFALPLIGATELMPSGLPKITVAILSSDEAVHRELVELDQLLDSQPTLEEVLRKSIDRLDDERFRKSIPEIDVLLTQRPGIVPALKIERHFLIYRYVLRRARQPLLHADMLAFDRFLSANSAIRRELDLAPAQIMESGFLITHPSLAEFFEQHPSLSTVLLKPPTMHQSTKRK